MNVDIINALALFFYKISCLVVGLVSIYFGYRLFLAGIDSHPADVTLSVKDWWKVNVRKAAPGVMFALFGMIVAGSTVLKGYSTHELSERQFPDKRSINSDVVLPDKPPP
jgi:hypothetical protein